MCKRVNKKIDAPVFQNSKVGKAKLLGGHMRLFYGKKIMETERLEDSVYGVVANDFSMAVTGQLAYNATRARSRHSLFGGAGHQASRALLSLKWWG